MSLTRRNAIAATAALLAAARAATPRGAFAQGTTTPEVRKATLGYIALTDSAPVIIAKEKGFFAKHGMPDVEVNKQASWGATRDNLVLGGERGGIDGAHILTPMPYLMTAGRVTQNNQPVAMVITARLNTNGQAISVAEKHKALGTRLDAGALKRAMNAESKFAMTFRGGTHDMWIRYWLAAGGIDPDREVQTIVVPPPQMVANMRVGTMDAFCVGEPWNAQLVSQNLGYTALVTGELWKDHPEKSFALRADFAEKHPRAAEALTAAVIEAQRWCDVPANKEEMCNIIGRRAYLGVATADILGRMRGEVNYGDGRSTTNYDITMKFWRDHASYPFHSHDLWFLTENIRWGIMPAETDTRGLIAQVNREGIWRAAAARAGVPNGETPSGTSRGPETFFDGKVFDPANPAAYLASLAIKRSPGT
ncbi:nitrate ABC transporter substrate-binding protein [Paracraurococcus ruber]|uniref:Bicarbonate-binding protein n=2 Tax=Paracraurococcus ruber TaxID=77675 RepID=A0ABS1D1V0_9PROT|nr:CmpA/NrtA family ABC transporter substrate-binding protein [Paracraurococcus ruber]MBK1660092.1 bicarbonate-binding protein [Paracraurococcus ruber]TDG29956.1 nitrate ABC transporter substrate-binding protein [Paracraurococcus ruber]